jgi:hypothetical protein
LHCYARKAEAILNTRRKRYNQIAKTHVAGSSKTSSNLYNRILLVNLPLGKLYDDEGD